MFDNRPTFGVEYQNLFNRVLLDGPIDEGAPLKWGDENRVLRPFLSRLMGSIGAAQVGPFYLGALGITSILCGFIAFEIIGLNMLAQVHWDFIQFIRQLPWLGLQPPGPQYGLEIFPPLAKGGWWLMAGFFLTTSILLWWTRVYRRARDLGMGTHVAWAFAAAIWLYLVLGLHPADPDGELVGGGAIRHLPSPGLDGVVLDPLRQPLLLPVPYALDRVPVWLDAAFRDAWGDDPGGQPLLG